MKSLVEEVVPSLESGQERLRYLAPKVAPQFLLAAETIL
jgi:hypothetical protein